MENVGKSACLLPLLAACVRAGGVEDFQGPGSSVCWTVRVRGAGGPLAPDTRLCDRRCDGVAVEEPELREEVRGGNTVREAGSMNRLTHGVIRVTLGR